MINKFIKYVFPQRLLLTEMKIRLNNPTGHTLFVVTTSVVQTRPYFELCELNDIFECLTMENSNFFSIIATTKQ